MTRRPFRLAAVALASLALAASAGAQQAAPAGLAQAIAATEAAKLAYAFDLELASREQNWRARFDPGATPRLRLIEPNRDSLGRDEQRALDNLAERLDGVSWCASEQFAQISDVRLLREDDASATYAFQPTRESLRDERARQFANRLRGELTLTKSDPDVARIRIFAPEAFSPFPLVRLDRLDITIRCGAAPNGRRYASETVSELRGSAFGQAFDERSVQRARNLSAP